MPSVQWNPANTSVLSSVTNALAKYPSSANYRLGEYIFATVVVAAVILFTALSALAHIYLGLTFHFKYLNYILLLVPGALFFPTVTALSKMFFGCFSMHASSLSSNPFFDDVICWSGAHVGYSVLSILLLAVWVAAAVLIALTFVDHTIPSNLNRLSYTAAAAGRMDVNEVLVRFILLVLCAGIHNPSGRYPISILIVLSGFLLSYLYLRHLPFYNENYQSLLVFRSFMLTLAGFTALLCTIFDDYQSGPAMFLYVFTPVLLAAAFLTVHAQYSLIEIMPSTGLVSPYQFELRIRCVLRAWMRTEMDDTHGLYLEETPERAARRKAMQDDTEKLLHAAVARFPDSAFLHAYMGLYYICVQENRVLAYRGFQACDLKGPKFDTEFMVTKFRRILDRDTANSQSSEVQSYLEFKARKTIAEAAVLDAARNLVEFWSHLLRPSPDIETLAQQGHQARGAMHRATINFEKLLLINPNSVPILKSYGAFALDVLADVSKSKVLFDRALEVERTRDSTISADMKGDFLQTLDTNLDIFDERNGVYSITVDRTRLGEIESVNPTGRRIVGYTQEADMVGKNIRIIVPSPMAEDHDQYLLDFVTNKTGRIINQTRMIFAVHKAGYLVPGFLYVRWADAANGKIVGVFRTASQASLTADAHLMVDPKGVITYCTSNAYGLFGIHRRQLAGREVRLQDIFPEMVDHDDADRTDRRWEQMHSRTGLALVGRSIGNSSVPVAVHAYAVTTDVRGKSCVFVRLVPVSRDDEDENGVGYASDGSLSDSQGDLGDELEEEEHDGALDDDYDGEDDAAIHGGKLNGRLHSGMHSRRRRHMERDSRARRDSHHSGGSEAEPGTRNSGNRNHDFEARSENSNTRKVHDALRRRKDKERGRSSLEDGTESVGTSTASTGNKSFNHKRLTKAIHNENKHTSKRLELMSWYVIGVMLLVTGGAIAFQLVGDAYGDFSLEQSTRLHTSGEREALVAAVAIHTRTLTMLSWDSAPLFVRPLATGNTTATIAPFFFGEITFELQRLQDRMNAMDASESSIDFQNAAQRRLYHEHVVPFTYLSQNAPVVHMMGMKQASTALTSAANLAVYSAKTNIETSADFSDASTNHARTVIPITPDRDIKDWPSAVGVFATIHNGMLALRDAIILDSSFVMDVAAVRQGELIWILIAISIVTVVAISLVLFFLVRPIVLRVEVAKSQVLDMFLDIPRPVRRTIRRRVYNVYVLMRSQDVDDGGAQVTSMRDNDNGAEDTAGGRGGGGGDGETSDAGGPDFSVLLDGNGSEASASPAVGPQARFNGSGSVPIARSATRGPGQSGAKASGSMSLFKNGGRLGHGGRDNGAGGGEIELASGFDLSSGHGLLRPFGASQTVKLSDGESKADEATSNKGLNNMVGRKDGENKAGYSSSTSSQSRFSRRALRILAAKFIFFVAVVAVYFIVITVKFDHELSDVQASMVTMDYANQRRASFLRSYYYVREYLFGNYTRLKQDEPMFPTLFTGEFSSEAHSEMDVTMMTHHSIIFGNATMNLETPFANAQQDTVVFADACSISNDDQAALITRPISSRFTSQCSTFMGGVLKRGMHSALLQYQTMLTTLLQSGVESVASPMLNFPYGNANYSVTSPQGQAALTIFRDLDTLAFEFIDVLLERSSALYLAAATEHVQSYRQFRVAAIVAFLVLSFFIYLIVFQPMIRVLNTAARNTRAMMLVLPPDIVKSIPSVQTFILQNYQRND